MDQHIVIAGGGQAAVTCIMRLRALGHEAKVTLVTNESYLPYQRPPLSKQYLKAEMTLEQLIFQPAAWYQQQQVDVMLETALAAIHPHDHKITLSNGGQLGYDKLVLTLGAIPLRLPAAIGGDLDNVFTIRDVPDVDAIANVLKARSRVLIVGGGYIGLEAAAVTRQTGAEVTLLESRERILARVASEQTAAYFTAIHRGQGVDIRTSASLAELEGKEGKVVAARLSDGESIAVDLVLVGIGIRPNSELAGQAGLGIDNGILVNEYCQTSNDDIYAAGDCASFSRSNEVIRLESVQNANAQSEVIAQNLCGNSKTNTTTPWFWSDQYDVKLQIAGLNNGFDQIVERVGEKPGARSFWYYRDGQLIAVDAINEPGAFSVARRALDLGKNISQDEVADQYIPLKQIMKSLANR